MQSSKVRQWINTILNYHTYTHKCNCLVFFYIDLCFYLFACANVTLTGASPCRWTLNALTCISFLSSRRHRVWSVYSTRVTCSTSLLAAGIMCAHWTSASPLASGGPRWLYGVCSSIVVLDGVYCRVIVHPHCLLPYVISVLNFQNCFVNTWWQKWFIQTSKHVNEDGGLHCMVLLQGYHIRSTTAKPMGWSAYNQLFQLSRVMLPSLPSL